jgi:hypothetical protein
MTPTWKAVIGVILIFILGWFGGALTTLVIARHKAAVLVAQQDPEAIAIMLERRTTHDLGLTPEQRTQLHSIFVENLKQRLELQKTIQPQVKAVNRQTIQQINAILNAQQQQRFHENLVLFKQRFGRNPFNIGPENGSAQQPPPPQNYGAIPYVPATNAPASGQ